MPGQAGRQPWWRDVKALRVALGLGSGLGTKMMVTPEGGLAIRLTNKTGGVTTKGYLVTASTGTDKAFAYCAVDQPDIIGAVYEAGVADASECWVVVAGIADVYFMGSTTRGHFARNIVAADGGASGQAVSEVKPGTPFATDKHFAEVGHVLETRVGAGLAKVAMHFN